MGSIDKIQCLLLLFFMLCITFFALYKLFISLLNSFFSLVAVIKIEFKKQNIYGNKNNRLEGSFLKKLNFCIKILHFFKKKIIYSWWMLFLVFRKVCFLNFKITERILLTSRNFYLFREKKMFLQRKKKRTLISILFQNTNWNTFFLWQTIFC